MRVKWRGLELPTRVERDASVSNDRYGRFFIEPFERGFGTTIGNGLRRVLLSSLEGSAVTSVKTAGVNHDVEFDMEMLVENGRGYVPASERIAEMDRFDQEIGVIMVDAIYSPVTRVRYTTEDTRVGQRTNYDRLILEIWTNGTVAPEMALVEAAKILRKHINPFIQYFELGEQTVAEQVIADEQEEPEEKMDEELVEKIKTPIQELELSVRASNCLEAVKVETVGQLAAMTEADLLKIRSFGKTSLREVRRKLADIGLSLGMTGI